MHGDVKGHNCFAHLNYSWRGVKFMQISALQRHLDSKYITIIIYLDDGLEVKHIKPKAKKSNLTRINKTK